MALSVLYINRCGALGGASRSIYELISSFPLNEIHPYMIVQKGSSAEFFRKKKIPVIETIGLSQFDNTQYSYYRGLRWLILLREFAYIPSTIFALLRARQRWPHIDIIHVNEITGIPIILLCLILFNKPIIVHARSVQRYSMKSIRTKIINKILTNSRIKRIIAIDETVKNSLSKELNISVVHNSFSVDTTRTEINSQEISQTTSSRPLMVGFVGNFLIVKGIYELVEAARKCKDNNLNVKFVIIGFNPAIKKSILKYILKKARIIQDSSKEILELIETQKLETFVRIEPFSADISRYYLNIDVLCFPSHLNAIGRPVIEAAFYKIPSIVAIKDPMQDTFIDGETGIAFEEKSPHSLYNAIKYFIENPNEIRRMGTNAFTLAERNFTPHKNALKVLEIYKHFK